MSIKGRVKARISWTVVSALALLVLVLLSGVFYSCCPASENNSTKVTETEIKANRYKVINASSNRFIASIFVFELEGHKYAMNYGEHYFIHLASCPCHQNESLILTPSSSLFNW